MYLHMIVHCTCSLRCVVSVASSKELLVPAEVILPQSTLGRHHLVWARPRSGQLGHVTDIHTAECRQIAHRAHQDLAP